MNERLNKIHLGDALEYLKSLPDGVVDLIVSSPPYNIGKEYEKRSSLDDYLKEQKKILSECVRLLKPGGSIFWQVGAYSHSSSSTFVPLDLVIYPILLDLNLFLQNRIIWAKNHGVHARKKFSCRHETILWFSKGKSPLFNLDDIRVPQKYANKKHYSGKNKGKLSCNPKGKNPGDVWAFANVKHNNQEQTIHPCQFPEGLVARIVLACSNKGDVVLDPYMGAGTVAVVVQDLDRNFLGSEADKGYLDVANHRLSGEPDENNCFPNLKTLRSYVDDNGVDIANYTFTRQKTKVPSSSSQSKIHSEPEHLGELFRRLSHEEDKFLEGFDNLSLDNGSISIKNVDKKSQLDLDFSEK